MKILSSNEGYHTIRILIDGARHDLTVMSSLEGEALVAFLNDYATTYEKDLRAIWVQMAAEAAALAEEAGTPNV